MADRDCRDLVVTDYIILDNDFYVKVYRDGNYETVLINKNEVDEIIKSYVCYKTGKSEYEFNCAEDGIITSPAALIYLENLEPFFLKLYGLNSLMDVLDNPDADFSWRRLAGGMGSLVFELDSGIRLEADKLRELKLYIL